MLSVPEHVDCHSGLEHGVRGVDSMEWASQIDIEKLLVMLPDVQDADEVNPILDVKMEVGCNKIGVS